MTPKDFCCGFALFNACDYFARTRNPIMSKLFSPIKLGPLNLNNRIIVAPMCQYSADNGNASDWHMIHLGQMALSGAGLLIIEATAVEPIGRITPGCLGLWSDENEAALKSVMQAIRKYSSMPVMIQLAHAGRKASSARPWEGGQLLSAEQGGWQVEGPSDVPHGSKESAPLAMDKTALARVKKAFVDTAMRSMRLGFDGIELHGAHGYLLHQFLSPVSNHRTDEYGGSAENRMRFPLEVFEAVRRAVPDTCLGIRISGTDWVEHGQPMQANIEFGNKLKALGCDFIHVSTGGVAADQKIPVAPKFQIPFATQIKQATGLPTMAVGLITDPKEAEQILADEQADMVALARGMLYDPRWPWHAAAELGASVEAAPQYWRSQPRGLSHLFKDATYGGR
jgi:2,4-dienoyl-CoA reductase-like NADH-dependent reductase (Old Yellow Enzyme family)